MSFEISYDKQPEKFLEKLDKHIAARISIKLNPPWQMTQCPIMRLQLKVSMVFLE